MTFLAIVFPWLYFFAQGKILQGIACLILQALLLGWVPASIWAMRDLINTRWERRKQNLIQIMESSRAYNIYTCWRPPATPPQTPNFKYLIHSPPEGGVKNLALRSSAIISIHACIREELLILEDAFLICTTQMSWIPVRPVPITIGTGGPPSSGWHFE